jgi:2-methylcitrate dehydratase PrpD
MSGQLYSALCVFGVSATPCTPAPIRISHPAFMATAPVLKPTAIEGLAVAALHARGATGAPLWHAHAATHVLDWLGCAAQGSVSEQGQGMARWLALQARGDVGGDVPTLAGLMANASDAAAYHGALGSALEMDDVHRSAVLHPGPVVIPAALAACTPSTSGAQFLNAVLSGYEVMVRVGLALGPEHYKLWHTTSTAGSFGAAAAAAAVMGLDLHHTAQALALAGTRASGLWQVRHETQLGKAWHTAGAARDGLTAAQLASVGFTGPLGVLDGPAGWFAASATRANASVIFDVRDEPWLTDVSFKPWPACRHAHPAMDALQSALSMAQQTHTVHATDVQHIAVHTYADALRFCDRPAPQDEAQARFSIQHALAAWLCWGDAQLVHYQDAALVHAPLQALRERISLHQDAAFHAAYPAHYGARVQITWRDGSQVQAEVKDTLGDPARPLSPSALQNKTRLLMGLAQWPQARVQAAIDACADLPSATNLLALHRVIQP